MQIRREYNYSDVYLLPNKCIVNSRSECDTSVVFGDIEFDLPVSPSNMPAVVNEYTCEFLAKRNIFYTYHRFHHNQIDFLDRMVKQNLVTSISVGVNDESKEQIKEIKAAGFTPNFITIDIAHAWSPKMESMIKFIKDTIPNSYLIAGNVACGEAVQEVEYWGADCCRAGIGMGGGCSTKNVTGHTRPMISCLLDCVSAATKSIMADGGIKEIGDVNKALACSVDMVMAGSIFSGFNESGSEIVEIDGHKKCIYYGNASEHAKKGNRTHVEGKKIIIDYKGAMDDFLIELKEGIQSGISYAGGKDISAFQNSKMVAIN